MQCARIKHPGCGIRHVAKACLSKHCAKPGRLRECSRGLGTTLRGPSCVGPDPEYLSRSILRRAPKLPERPIQPTKAPSKTGRQQPTRQLLPDDLGDDTKDHRLDETLNHDESKRFNHHGDSKHPCTLLQECRGLLAIDAQVFETHAAALPGPDAQTPR